MSRESKCFLYAILGACVAVFLFCGTPQSLALGTSVYARFCYMFAHGGWWHLLANVLALNAIARSRFRIDVPSILMAYVIAASVPYNDAPVVGASTFIYAVFGIISWQSAKRIRFHAIVVAFILLGFVLARSFANSLHAYCYCFGVAVGYAKRIR